MDRKKYKDGLCPTVGLFKLRKNYVFLSYLSLSTQSKAASLTNFLMIKLSMSLQILKNPSAVVVRRHLVKFLARSLVFRSQSNRCFHSLSCFYCYVCLCVRCRSSRLCAPSAGNNGAERTLCFHHWLYLSRYTTLEVKYLPYLYYNRKYIKNL